MDDHGYQIVADVPTDSPGLGFEQYAEAIADSIRYGHPAQFTVGLYGKWGSGKSSLLKAIKGILDDVARDEIVTVEFDAWRYQRSEAIVVPLLHAVLEQVRRRNDATLTKSMARLVRAIGMSVTFRLPVVGSDMSIGEMKNLWDGSDEVLTALDHAFGRPFAELRLVGQELGSRRVVVLVDDLDRCTAANLVSVLESVNVITDVPGFVFVLALDYDVLVAAVSQQYPGISGHEFVEKIVQLPFRIPRLDASPAMFETVIPQFSSMAHLKPIATEVAAIVDIAFDANPRSTKRFVNALTLLLRILDMRDIEVAPEVAAAILAGELRWPDAFADVRTAVAASDADPLRVIRSGEDERLVDFAERVLPKGIARATLDQILRFTATVAAGSTEDQAEKQTVGRVTDNIPVLIAGLLENGYRQSPQSERIYYHPTDRTTRFKLGKIVVRLERNRPSSYDNQMRWDLERSYSLAREVDDALKRAHELVQDVGTIGL